MRRFWAVLIGVPVFMLGAWFGWRMLSRRRSMPCPPWLGWLLENPFTEGISGEAILDQLGIEPGMRVLDVGCGPGRLSVPAAKRVGSAGEVVAVDIQPEMLRRAQVKAAAAGVENIRFVLAGAGQGKMERDAFDRALLVTVLGEIPDRLAALQEIRSALRPGGRLAVAELIFDPHYQRRQTVRSLAAQAGLYEYALYRNSPFAYVIVLARL